MVTFNFSNVSGNPFGRRFVDSTTISTITPSGRMTPATFTFVTKTEGVNPIEFTPNLTGQGLPGDTMKFTVTATSPNYSMRFRNADDELRLAASDGISALTGVYTLRFDAGSGLTKLSNLSINGGGGVVSSVSLLTESGATFVTTGAGTFAGEYTGIRFTVFGSVDLASVTGTPTCFAEGTRLATPDGHTEVQDLMPGDMVLCQDGEEREVLWVGHQSFDTTRGIPPEVSLVRIAAGALGEGLPNRDLVVTADHAVFVDGHLINAGALVNGHTICFETPATLGKTFTVYHVETRDHELLVAEGVASESFHDARQRRDFDNYDAYLDRFGGDRIIPHMNLPRISSRRLVPAGVSAHVDPRDNAA